MLTPVTIISTSRCEKHKSVTLITVLALSHEALTI